MSSLKNALSICRAQCLGLVFFALVALFAIGIALQHITAATDGLTISRSRVGQVPVTLYLPSGEAKAPAVVIAHGFAGSQRLMQPYAVSLARNGYLVVTFDFPGHGHNPEPFVSSLQDQERRLRVLLDGLEPAVDFAMKQPRSDGRLSLLGHSMAGDVLVRYAQAHPGKVASVVLLSPYLSDGAPTASVRDLLLVYGELEPTMLHEQGLRILSETAGTSAVEGLTYGDPAEGTARRLVFAKGVEHIGILFGAEGIRAATDWLNQVFGVSGKGFIDQRGPWLGLLYLGLVALAWPLSRLLPKAASEPLGAGMPWRQFWPVAVAPAVLTPLLLWKVDHHFLPVLIGDYLAAHFAVYGLITLISLRMVRRRGTFADETGPRGGTRWPALLLSVALTTIYLMVAIVLPTDRFVTTLLPDTWRMPIVAALLVGTLTYFVADEWSTRGPLAARGGYAATKALFLLSLLFAVALNLGELFFLIIIVPAILIFFLVFGVMSPWIYRGTGHPLTAALANALVFASAMAVTFPMVANTT